MNYRSMGKKGSSILYASLVLFAAGCAQTPSVSGTTLSESQMFTLPDVKGEQVSLAELLKKNKAVLINFWATWCPPCREEIPDLIKLHNKYRESGFAVLGVDVGESQKRVSSFMEKGGITYPVVLDMDQAVAEAYQVYGVPTSLLVNSEGKILGEYHAATPQLFSDVEKALS